MTESKALSPIQQLQNQLNQREGEFAKVLPGHIPPHRFIRVAMTAVQNDLANPYSKGELMRADRSSFFRACLQCAQEGLLPDGREAVLVTYKMDGNLVAQYQPMIAGIRKKVRQSGEIVSWEARLAHEHDEFEIVLGDDERIVHKPLLHGDRGPIIAVYSRAVFKDGFISRDWMTIAEVENIRRRARTQKVWTSDYGEMVKKTMLKRHSKALPLSVELDRLLAKEEEAYDLNQPPLQPIATPRVLDGDTVRWQVDAASSGNGVEPKKKRGRPRLSDLRAEPETAAAQAEPIAEPQESFSATEKLAEPDYADWHQVGYDAYFEGHTLRPYPKECRGHENKAAAELY